MPVSVGDHAFFADTYEQATAAQVEAKPQTNLRHADSERIKCPAISAETLSNGPAGLPPLATHAA